MYVMHLWLSSVAHQAVMFSGFNKINIVRFQFWFAHIRNIILHKFLVDVLSKRDDKWVFFLGLLLIAGNSVLFPSHVVIFYF